MRATLTGAFTSAGMFGSVLGLVSSGVIAESLWLARRALIAMAALWFLLILFFAFTVTHGIAWRGTGPFSWLSRRSKVTCY